MVSVLALARVDHGRGHSVPGSDGDEGQPMNWMGLRSAGRRRPTRPALPAVAAAAAAAVLLGACSSASGGTTSGGSTGAGSTGAGALQLNPPSGRVSLTPTWSTTAACPAGYQGSGILRIVEPNGSTFSLSPVVDDVTVPFKGTMLDPLGLIQDVASVPNGGTAELVVLCFSGPALTGKLQREMDTYATFSANGFNYTTSSTPPAGFSNASPAAAAGS
jgi:hypothetical protein